MLYVMGDSLTEQPTYPNALIGLVNGGGVNTPYKLSNKGIGGNTTAMMLSRFYTDVLSDKSAKYVVIWGGVNSVRADVSAATIESELQTMYTDAHNQGLIVIAVNIAPFKGFSISPGWTTTRQDVLDSVNSWIVTTAKDVDYKIDVYSVLEGATDTLNASYDGGDHLHLSTAGYNLVANTIYNNVVWEY